MKLIDRYLASAIIGSTAIVLLVLLALTGFLTFFTELEDVGQGAYSTWDAAYYTVLLLPELLYEMFPVGALLGALMGLGALAAHSELTVMRAAGMSTWRLGVSAGGSACLLALCCYFVGDWLVPITTDTARTLRAEKRIENGNVQEGKGVWFRDANRFVFVRKVQNAGLIEGVDIIRINDKGQLETTAHADNAEYKNDEWILNQTAETVFYSKAASSKLTQQKRWDAGLAPSELELFAQKPDQLPLRKLWTTAAYLKRNGLDSSGYEQAFWRKLVAPISVIVMACLATPFAFGSLRSSAASQRLVLGVLVGAGYYLINRILGNVGQVFDVHPALVAWLPTLVLASLAFIALRRIR